MSAISLALAILIGIWLGVIRAFTKARNPLNWVLDAYVFFVRGTPIIVQIFVLFFLAPELGLRIDPYWVGIIALTFNSAGYQIEIGRAAVRVGGRGAVRRLARARPLAPEDHLARHPAAAVRRMIAPLTNEMSQLIKASSVLSVITVFELHKAANAISSASFKYVELLALQAVFYLVLILSVSRFARWIETSVLGAGEGAADFQVR